MTHSSPGAPEDRSVGELFADLTRDVTTLVKQEITLAKTEMSQKFAKLGKDVGFLFGGILFAYVGFLALVAALIIGLGQTVMPMWASALLVGLVFAAVGGFLVKKGLDAFKSEDLVPRETIESLQNMKQGV